MSNTTQALDKSAIPDFSQDPHNGITFVPITHHDTYPAINSSKANLSGKVVLVTGASKGIGRAIALSLAKASVSGLILVARSDMKALEAECLAAQRPGQSLKVLALSGVDTTNPAHVAGAVAKAKGAFDRLDIVINNAGLMESMHLIADSDPLEWWRVWEVNVRGTYNVTRAFLPDDHRLRRRQDHRQHRELRCAYPDARRLRVPDHEARDASLHGAARVRVRRQGRHRLFHPSWVDQDRHGAVVGGVLGEDPR